MDGAMDEVLKTIGWETGFRLPVANDENQALEAEMAVLVMKKSNLIKSLEDVEQRRGNLNNHLKYVHQEVKQNQTLLTAYKQQLNNENNNFKLTMAERDNVNQEICKMKKNTEDIQARTDIKRGDLARCIQKLEKIKAEVSWDAEAMKAWEESLKKRDEDNELLKKFSAEDQKKMLELEAKRVNLQAEVTQKRNMVEKMSEDIITLEHSVTRFGKILKQMKDERNALKKQWYESVKNLRQRDQDIKRANNEIDELQDRIQHQKEVLGEQIEFLNNEIRSNKLLEVEIEEHNMQNSKMRQQLRELTDIVSLLNNEVHIKKKDVEATAHDLVKVQMDYKNTNTDISEKEIAIWTLGNEVEEVRERLEQVKQKTLSSSERSKQIEEMVEATQRQTRELELEYESVQGFLYRSNTALAESKEFAVLRQAEIKGGDTILAGIRKRYKKESVELIHQKQILSDLEMKVACVQAKLDNIEGEPEANEDISVFSIKVEKLEGVLAEQMEIKNMLHVQNILLQKESLRLVAAISNDTERLQKLKDKLHGLVIMYEGGIKQVTALKLLSQQKQVQENVLKLKVDKLNKAMSRADKEIYDLQKYKIDLEMVMKERQIEIQTARDILLAKKKNLDEERGRLRGDISIRITKIKQLRNKYELAIGCLGKDEAGEPLSMAHYKIKAAQEKYLLHQEGDNLDKKVRKAETEIVAMENTLKVVNSTNSLFRKSLETVPEQSEEANLFNELEEILKDRTGELFEKKKLYLEKHTELKAVQNELKSSEDVRVEMKDELFGKQDICTKLECEEKDRLEKIERADKQICHYKKNINLENRQKYDKEIFIRQLLETNKSIMYQIADFNQQNFEVTPLIRKYFTAYGLEVPTVRTRLSSVSSDSINTPSTVPSGTMCNVHSLELTFGEPSPKPKKEAKKVNKKKGRKT